MGGDKILYGPFTFVCWGIGLLLTAAVGWLGFATWETLQVPFSVLFLGGIVLNIVAYVIGKGRIRLGIGSVWIPVAAGLMFLFVSSVFLKMMFETYAVERFDNLFIGVLFAIYETTGMLGAASMLTAAGVPDIWNIVVTTAFFLPMHALRYPMILFFDLFIIIGGTVLAAALLISDNSDVPYYIHILWNVVNSL